LELAIVCQNSVRKLQIFALPTFSTHSVNDSILIGIIMLLSVLL